MYSPSDEIEKLRVLVIAAHAADFVWRCSGTIANYSARGDEVKIICLTYGERGESDSLWKHRKGITVEEVKAIRKKESEEAARILGVSIVFLDWGDHPLVIGEDRCDVLVKHMREFRPQIVITHHFNDSMNPDHPEVYNAVMKAVRYAVVSGVHPETTPLPPVQVFLCEPHDTDLQGFNPDTYIDITSSYSKKLAVMEVVKTQAWLVEDFTSRAKQRANLANRYPGGGCVGSAEAFERVFPRVGSFF